MKALTVRQPWAWAIVYGGKDVENRTQAWSYRGPLAIHAGTRVSDRGMRSDLVRAAWAEHGQGDPLESLVIGAIIGVVDLVDVHVAVDGCCDSPWGEREYGNGHPDFDRLRRRDIVHLVLEHPRPLRRPIPARGRLGLWDLDGEQLAELVGSGVLSGMECV